MNKCREPHVIWTQFYADRFSPSNRYHLSRQAQSLQLKELANIICYDVPAGSAAAQFDSPKGLRRRDLDHFGV